MPPQTPRHRRTVDYLALMEPWPGSWAGTDEDKPIGRNLVAVLRPFMNHLQHKQLTPRTLRRHLDNLWLIGGETIRELHYDSTLRTKCASELLLQTIADGEAPLVRDLTETEQSALDATARKLLRFLTASNH